MNLRRLNHVYWLLAISFWLLAIPSFSQAVFSSEEDLKKEANKLFEDEDFAKAYPLFSQLLSLYPKDAQYNYKFGTCLLFASNDKEKAIPYIEFAAKRQKQDVDKEVFFYLGKAYHLNYRFADAIKSYNTFKLVASAKQVARYDVDRQIEMCESGKRLLKTVTELAVLDKKEVPVADFFRSYNLSEFNAKLIIKPDDLKTSLDKKKKDESLMYLAPDRNQIYYSSYGEDGKTGRDIYYVTRSSGGDLSKPTRVSDMINTKYDEDFAFLHPNGQALYFCSKGHNSMGGYDIFRSQWDNATQAWGKPVNMDFAINTPDDDILFISDADDKTAYFSSKRESAEGSISVYRIKLERKPLDLAIIKGVLTKNVGDRMAKATITVTKLLKDEVVGVFHTNAADGSYTLNLPNGGKFMLSVESAGFKKSSELVVIPSQQEIKPMKQEISLVNENGQDKLIVKNDFEAQIDSADMQLAIEYIKAKASLPVSPEEEKITAVAVEENNTSASAEPKNEVKSSAPVTNKDIIDIGYQDAKETQKDANELLKNSEAAKLLSRQKNDLSIQKYNEAAEATKYAQTIVNQEEKLAQNDKAAKLRKESETLSKESVMSLNLSNQMEIQAAKKQEQADAELKYAKDLDNAIKTGASEKKMNELLAQKESLDKKSDSLDASYPPDLNKEMNETQAQASKAMAKYIDIQQDVEDLQGEAKRLRTEAEKSTNDGVKQNLNQQAEEMEKEAATKKKDAETYNANAKQLQSRSDSLKTSASLTSSVMKEIQSSAPQETSTASNTAATTSVTANAVQETASVTPVNTAATNTVTATTPVASPEISSPYVDVFVNQMHDAEKKTNELEKEQSLAVIYQSWTDSLDKQIGVLKNRLDHITNPVQIAQTQNKIYELQSSVEDKRQRAADSRSKVDNLKLQAALAEASAVTPETTAAATKTVSATNPESTSTSVVAPENLIGSDNINNYYSGKLKEYEKISNEYEKKSKEQELYQDWSASLYDESQRLKKDGKGGQASDAEKESKAKQAVAMRTADQVTQIKAEHPELVASANMSPAESPQMFAPAETKTVSPQPTASNTTQSTTQAATTNPAANTVTTTNPVETKTVSSTQPSNTATAVTQTNPVTETSTQAANNQPTIAAAPPSSVTHKDEYTHYASLKNEAEWSKKNAERQIKQADDLQKQADEQQVKSQQLAQKAEAMNDPNIKAVMQQQSDTLNKQAKQNRTRSDSLKILAKNSDEEGNSKTTESELYLQSLDRSAYEEVATATGRTFTEADISTHPVSAAKNNPVASNTTTTSVTPRTSTTVYVEPPTNTQTTVATSTETSSLPVKTEAPEQSAKNETPASTSQTTQPVKNESSPIANETANNTPVKTEPASNASSKTETSTSAPAITETVNNAPVKTESTQAAVTNPVSAAKTESSNNTTSATPSAAMLKYYDALFDKLELSGSSYTSSKPIPVNAPLPDGLVFKVQIGAFRNPIPQDLFKGIKPITAETTPQGLKRYTAGLFNKFATANKAKTQVNGLGYRDAFVVAFFNGKRISMNEALAKARDAGETISEGTVNSSSPQPNTNSNITAAGTNIANSTDVKTVNGLFYTIQIGVFSRPTTSAQLYNIAPLNSERTDNGLIRYTTGRFSSETTAIKAKNSIAGKGISDAFVVAYLNGKRIGLTAAKSMIDSQGSSVLSKDKQEYSFIPTDTTTTEKSATSLTNSSNKGIVFKVQIGAFKEQVPVNIANKFLKVSEKGIKTFTDENGLMVYTVGEVLEYESANALKNEMIGQGLTGSFVIAFKDGKKMSAADALNLIGNR